MMITPNDLVEAFARNVMIIKRQTEGLTHEDSMRQPPSTGNCLNWVLGHMVATRDDILATLGAAPVMGDAGMRYKRGSDPITTADNDVLRLEELLEWFDRSQQCIADVLGGMDAAALSRELTFGDQKSTIGKWAFFLYFHETYHTGQIEIFRQLAGKDDKVF